VWSNLIHTHLMSLKKNYENMVADFRKRGLGKDTHTHLKKFLWKKLVASHAKHVVFVTEARSWSKRMNTDIDGINEIDTVLKYPQPLKTVAKNKAVAAPAKDWPAAFYEGEKKAEKMKRE